MKSNKVDVDESMRQIVKAYSFFTLCTFNNREEYLDWREGWRKTYQCITELSRFLKSQRSPMRSNHSERAQNDVKVLAHVATAMLVVRWGSKVKAGRQWRANRIREYETGERKPEAAEVMAAE